MNMYTFNLSDVINSGMLPVIRKRDIVRAKVIRKAEKEQRQLNGDIMLTEPSGRVRVTTRKDIISTYTYLNGKKISISGWEYDKEYMIFKLDSSSGFAMMVPLNCTIEVGNRRANSSNRKGADYIIAMANANGEIDQDTIGIIPSALFKKMFYFPPNEIIQKNIGKGHKLFGYGPGGEEERASQYQGVNTSKQGRHLRQSLQKQPRYIEEETARTRPKDFSSQMGIDTSTIDFGIAQAYGTDAARQGEVKPQGLNGGQHQGNWSRRKLSDVSSKQARQLRQPAQSVQTAQRQSIAPYTAIGRLINQSGQVVGFVIQKNTGQTAKITLEQMKDICSKHLVTNVMITLNPTNNSYFLRGNNIRLETLPAYPI